eukprot:3697300-Ditylum_brightwellii.AAC.1
MNLQRSYCAAVSMCGKIIVVGGYDRNTTETCEAYDPTTCQWSNAPSMQTKRRGCAAVEVDGTLYVMGGHDGTNKLSSVEKLEIQQSNNNDKCFTKLFEKDDRNINFKCKELMSNVEDVHQMKLLYTCINCLFNTNTINQEDCKRYISGSLERVSSSTTCREAIAVFKQLLDKAKQDGIISDHEYYSFESEAVVARVGAAPFVREIWKSIHNIQTR